MRMYPGLKETARGGGGLDTSSEATREQVGTLVEGGRITINVRLKISALRNDKKIKQC